MHYHIPVFHSSFQHNGNLYTNCPKQEKVLFHQNNNYEILSGDIIMHNDRYHMYYNVRQDDKYYSYLAQSDDVYSWDIIDKDINNNVFFIDKYGKFQKIYYTYDKKNRIQYSFANAKNIPEWDYSSHRSAYCGHIQSVFYNYSDDNYYIYLLDRSNPFIYERRNELKLIKTKDIKDISNKYDIVLSNEQIEKDFNTKNISIIHSKIFYNYDYFLLFVTVAFNEQDIKNLQQIHLYYSEDGINFNKLSNDFYYKNENYSKLLTIGYCNTKDNHNLIYNICRTDEYHYDVIDMAVHLCDRVAFLEPKNNQPLQCSIQISDIKEIGINADILENGKISYNFRHESKKYEGGEIIKGSIDQVIKPQTNTHKDMTVDLNIKNSKFYGINLKYKIIKSPEKSIVDPAISKDHIYDKFIDVAISKNVFIYIRSGAFYNATGGAQRPQQIADELSRRGFPVIYFAYKNPRSPIYQDNKTIVRPMEDLAPYVINAPDVEHKIFLTAFPDYISTNAMQFMDKNWFVHYDCVDDWQWFAKIFQWYGEILEGQICERSNLITSTGRTMIGRLINQAGHNNVKWLPNSTCIDLNNMELSKYDQYDLVFVGTFEDWVDIDLIKILSEKYKIIIIGKCEGKYKIESDNIDYVGAYPVESLPPILSKAKIGIIPFRNISLVTAVDPIKYYDYLATGLPTISTYMPELLEREHCYVSNNYDEFIDNIDMLLSAKVYRKKIMSFAKEKHTIDKRVDFLLKEWSL